MDIQTEVSVVNGFNNEIKVIRQIERGKIDMDMTIADKKDYRFTLPNAETSLMIMAPKNVRMDRCPISVKSDVLIKIMRSTEEAYWTVEIDPNGSAPNLPNDVKVEVGPEEPD